MEKGSKKAVTHNISDKGKVSASEQRAIDNLESLHKAMEVFNAATEKLQSSHELLQGEAKKLREEVEEKNRELQSMSTLLNSVLNNTRSSILVTNLRKGGAFQLLNIANILSIDNIVIKNKSGDKLIAEIGVSAIEELLSECFEEGVFEHTLACGKTFRVSSSNIDIGDSTNGLSGMVFVVDDITILKKLEYEKQRDEKLKIMGEMVANIAHDIRNPLGSIELFASLLNREVEGDNQRLTENIVKSVRNINGIISNTLLFTKEMSIRSSSYVLVDIVDEVVLYLQHVLKDKSIKVINELDDEQTVYCDKELFHQVVMNILHNALDAAPMDKGRVYLRCSYLDGSLHLNIIDNGGGISQEMMSKLFLPFQTTKAQGTGLGLSIAYKIVKAHGGDIDVQSGEEGTQFCIIMPDGTC